MATWRQRIQEFSTTLRRRDDGNSEIPDLRPRRQFSLSPQLTTKTQRSPQSEPLISVILPVYNHQRFLAEAVYSVLTQSHQNLELIVVDDGSEEDITSTLQPFLKDPRMQLVRQDHLGLAAALNNGFSRAHGVFYSWTSADNCYLPKALQAMSQFLLANPKIDLTYANVDLINEDGTASIGSNYRPEDQLLSGSPRLFLPLSADTLLERPDNFINACFLYRQEIALQVGPYDVTTMGYEDYDYWIQIALCSDHIINYGSNQDNRHPCCHLLSRTHLRGPNISHLDDDISYYQYRLHDNTLTRNLNQERLATAGKDLVRAAQKVRGCSPRAFSMESALPPTSKEFLLLREAAHLIGSTFHQSVSKASSVETPPSREFFRLQLLDSDQNASTPENQTLLHAFRPEIFDQELSYTHSSHLAFHGDYAIRPFLFLAQSGNSSSRTSHETAKQVLVLPPLIIPQVLRRARDSFFGAIEKEPQSNASVLLFMPDFVVGFESQKTKSQISFITQMEQTASLITTLPKITFVLLALTAAQRQTADKIHTLSNYKRNVRIIDLSDRPFRRMDSNDTLEPDGLAQALMYVLSSVDVVLSLRNNHPLDPLTMLELRIECALAAAAGLRLLAIFEQTQPPQKSSSPERSPQELSEILLWSSISTSPALESIYLESKLSESNPSSAVQIEKQILALEANVLDQRSAEQWLQGVELARIGDNIASLFRLTRYKALKDALKRSK